MRAGGATTRRAHAAPSLIALSAVALLSFGCTVVQKTLFSAPAVDDPRAVVDRNAVAFGLPRLWLRIRAYNEIVTGETFAPWPLPPIVPTPLRAPKSLAELPPPLPIEIWLDPVGEGLTFDPMVPTLRRRDGEPLPPRGYVGPGHAATFPGLDPAARRAYPCEGDPGAETATPGLHAVDELTCFWLLYEVSPSPLEPFTFRLAGLARAGQPLEELEIRFEAGRARTLGSIP